MKTKDETYSNWEFYLFSSKFILVGIMLAFVINISASSIFNLVVNHDELFVIRVGLISLGIFVLYIILLTLSSDSKKKTTFDPDSGIIPRFIFKIIKKNNKNKSPSTNFLISLGVYEAILVYIGFILTSSFYFADFYLSITPVNSVLGGTLFFSVPSIFGIIFGFFISTLKWDSNELSGFFSSIVPIFFGIGMIMIIVNYLNLGFDAEIVKLGITLYLLIPFAFGVGFKILIDFILKTNKINVPEKNYAIQIESGKRYWNLRFLMKFFFFVIPGVIIIFLPERIVLTMLGIEKTSLDQYRHPIIAVLFAFLFLYMFLVLLGFLTILSEKPRIFYEHPLKNDVRKINSITGNIYTYSMPLIRRERIPKALIKGRDLQLNTEIPKFLIGKKVPYLFFYPMEFQFKRSLLEKVMNSCQIPIPSDICNGEIICLEEIGLKTKNGKTGDLYFSVKIISNIRYFINSCFLIAFVIIFFIIFVYVEFFVIESI